METHLRLFQTILTSEANRSLHSDCVAANSVTETIIIAQLDLLCLYYNYTCFCTSRDSRGFLGNIGNFVEIETETLDLQHLAAPLIRSSRHNCWL